MKKRFLLLAVILCLSAGVVTASAHDIEGVEVSSYNPKLDYMSLMYDCAKANTEYSLKIGYIYEQQRNVKILDMGLSDTHKTTSFFVGNDGPTIIKLMNEYNGNSADTDTDTKPQVQENPEQPELIRYYSNSDAIMLAKVAYCESRGIKSKTEIACVMWTILNRVDKGGYGGTIAGVITAPNQFAYRSSAPTVSDRGYDLLALAYDVLDNWSKEKSGRTDYVRCLPKNYLWYAGDGQHNYFRNAYSGGSRWNYAWGYPYG